MSFITSLSDCTIVTDVIAPISTPDYAEKINDEVYKVQCLVSFPQ
jgi:hypothetical protein